MGKATWYDATPGARARHRGHGPGPPGARPGAGGHTPWWEQAGHADLLLALALPFGAWLVLSAGLCVLGWWWTTTWAGTLTQAGLVAVAGFVAGVLLNLLLLDVYPDGGRFVLSLTLGVLALPVMGIALMVLVVRPALHRILERHASQSRRR